MTPPTRPTWGGSLTWRLEADTASTALLCLNTMLTGAPSFTGSECCRTDANGVLSGLVLSVDGKPGS